MRIDHIAYRVSDREEASKFFIEALGYKIDDEFQIDFEDETYAKCYAMSPPEKGAELSLEGSIRSFCVYGTTTFHVPPEVFISEGSEGSIVKKWVDDRGGIGGIHHIAYEVFDVSDTMKEWRDNNFATFKAREALPTPTGPWKSHALGIWLVFIQFKRKAICSL